MQASLPRLLDAHVHFWNPERLSYPWLSDAPSLRRPFLPEQFGALADRAVDALLFVEANCGPSDSEAELDFVDGLAAREPRIIGSVAFVDMTERDTRRQRLERLARRERVVGVRHNVQGHAAGYCLTSSFVAGVCEVGALGLTFDLCITADQLEDAIALVSRCRDVRFVLDHCGKPSIRSDAFAPWAAGIGRLSAFGNVACKLSGLFTEARPDQRNANALRPYVEHVRACFGPTRLLYGSDWPVVNLAAGEAVWRATIHELTEEWPAVDRQLFYSDNAMRHYAVHRHASY
jgi:L-fuconolactonase